MKTRLISASVLCLLMTSCATVVNPVSGVRERTVMDERSELTQGREYDKHVREEYGVYANEGLQSYVAGVGQRIARLSHRADLEWKFTVLDSPEINAFAVPGGYVYITRGLMAYLNSEAELAGVLGHEVGHVTARHGSRQATRSQVAGLGVLLATVAGAVIGDRYGIGNAADIASQGSQLYAQSRLMGYGREEELEADRLGAEYLDRANFDPDTMINVIGVLKAQETFANDQARAEGRTLSETPNWLRSHPANDQRLAEIRVIADRYSGKYADAGRGRYLQMIDGMTFGDSRVQGLARGKHFYHEGLGFRLTAAEGWRFQNSPSVLMVVKDDMSAAIALRASPNSRGDHNAAIRALLQPDTGNVRATTINALRATQFDGARQGKAIRATVISLRGADYVLQSLRKDSTSEAALRDTATIVQSFREMSADDVRDAKPYVLRTQTAKSPAPFAEVARSLARSAPQLRNPEGQLRLLNQVYPLGNVAVGSPVKVIQ